ncbi:MAG: hypothetical protein B7Z60_03145 [Ferrovum sp. 37-45-19]|jgi:hypothetical protein|uniref:hypothetical protein n=1 Tax=Ferrovum sp. JA12 TaxID=1356299 RepID=UPI000702E0FB|nr:hypothetical protein [Ferrovum sp. JA12]OYV80494.1 MAG: hypothetical protein B7Z65_01215 [Ferrovum sp. 21-44-67]OYV94809.1 MAG: hypothetical protein B7Z60_03145 [Ferrovum sp. 37-45-19]OZB34158.1 MAG: hypothetical protein B7X47_02030 [Ferrovum sp. 34-44-207]HQT81065.1 hypothetical protein [Ferrovaceae bacterium]KRH79210.1 hypothetical protein FERRO_02730 [Ferrovum sp. JA12]
MDVKEIIVYMVVGCSSLFLSAYTVHMVVGGLVSEHTEYLLMAVMCTLVGAALTYMVWDVYQRRKKKH